MIYIELLKCITLLLCLLSIYWVPLQTVQTRQPWTCQPKRANSSQQLAVQGIFFTKYYNIVMKLPIWSLHTNVINASTHLFVWCPLFTSKHSNASSWYFCTDIAKRTESDIWLHVFNFDPGKISHSSGKIKKFSTRVKPDSVATRQSIDRYYQVFLKLLFFYFWASIQILTNDIKVCLFVFSSRKYFWHIS